MRVLLFTGKGGVGKTTIAAATAVRAAKAGRRTLVMSTDPAHSLADSFDVELGPESREIAPNLWAEQIDAQERLEENWRDIQEFVIAFMNWAGVDAIEVEEVSVIPGLDEIFSLTDVKRAHDSGLYDLLVVDCAPTAETLRLLSLRPTGQNCRQCAAEQQRSHRRPAPEGQRAPSTTGRRRGCRPVASGPGGASRRRPPAECSP